MGGTIDAMLGAATFMTGTVLGGAIGGATALYGLGRRWARATRVRGEGPAGLLASVRQTFRGGPRYRIGPHADPNFPWVLLDRALLHYRAVARRTHAQRGETPLVGAGRVGLVSELGAEERKELEGLFRRLRRTHEDPPRELLGELELAVRRLVERVDPVPDASSKARGHRGTELSSP